MLRAPDHRTACIGRHNGDLRRTATTSLSLLGVALPSGSQPTSSSRLELLATQHSCSVFKPVAALGAQQIQAQESAVAQAVKPLAASLRDLHAPIQSLCIGAPRTAQDAFGRSQATGFDQALDAGALVPAQGQARAHLRRRPQRVERLRGARRVTAGAVGRGDGPGGPTSTCLGRICGCPACPAARRGQYARWSCRVTHEFARFWPQI